MLLKDKLKANWFEYIIRIGLVVNMIAFIIWCQVTFDIFSNTVTKQYKSKDVSEFNTLIETKLDQTIGPRMTRSFESEIDKSILDNILKYCDKVNLKLQISVTDPKLTTYTEITHMVENIGKDGKECDYYIYLVDMVEHK